MSEVDPAKKIISREEWQAAEQYLTRWRAVEADFQNASTA